MGKVKYRLDEDGIDGDSICCFVDCLSDGGFNCNDCVFENQKKEEYNQMTKEEAIIAIDIANRCTPKEDTPLEVNKTKYQRPFHVIDGNGNPQVVYTDVYGVLDAFKVGDSAIDHALKKLLAGGSRGAKNKMQDWEEAIQSIKCAIKLEEIKQKVKEQ